VRIYLDTAPIIYAVEAVTPYAAILDERLKSADIVLIASDLNRLECRVKPIREQDAEMLADYDRFFQVAIQELVALSPEVIDRATAIRAGYGFRTPDAIHLAAATVAQCDIFLTNDRRLQQYSGVAVQVLDTLPDDG
jgi:uncharacterized protein